LNLKNRSDDFCVTLASTNHHRQEADLKKWAA